MAKIKGKKGNTPENFDEFLRIREVISPDDYADYWRGVNRLKREFHENERGTMYDPGFAEAWSKYNDDWLLNWYRQRGGAPPLPPPEPPIEPPAPPPEPPIEKPKRVRRIVRRSKSWAVRDAKKFGGRVIRVDRHGKPNRRGRNWKAVKR